MTPRAIAIGSRLATVVAAIIVTIPATVVAGAPRTTCTATDISLRHRQPGPATVTNRTSLVHPRCAVQLHFKTSLVMPANDLLRHLVATLHYRTDKTLRDAPPDFGEFDPGGGARKPVEILAHITALVSRTRARLLDIEWKPEPPGTLSDESVRFDGAVLGLLVALEDAELGADRQEILLQGPISDAVTHAGQLAMLRRLAGSPISPEVFTEAEIDADELVQRLRGQAGDH